MVWVACFGLVANLYSLDLLHITSCNTPQEDTFTVKSLQRQVALERAQCKHVEQMRDLKAQLLQMQQHKTERLKAELTAAKDSMFLLEENLLKQGFEFDDTKREVGTLKAANANMSSQIQVSSS